MNDLLTLRALLFAGECFLVSLLLPLLGFAVTAGLRRRAALRHLVWTTLFGVLAVLPIVTLLLPPRQIVEHVAAPVVDTVPAMVDMPAIAAPVSLLDFVTLENVVLLLAALWLTGLCWQGLRLGMGAFGLMRLRRRSIAFAVETMTGCEVRLCVAENGPSTFGILSPLILLPRAAKDWPAARLEVVLRHEAAHVARRDIASQSLARLVCAVLWFNPLLWLGLRALRRDAEIAADDAVLASGFTPSLYAAELVALAAQSRGIAPGIAMARPPLTARVQSILAENSSRKGVSRMDIAKTVGFGLAATLLLGVARFDLAVAQDAPLPPVPPQVNVAVEVKPHVEVEKRVNVGRQENVDVRRAIEAQAVAVKHQADLMVAQSRARAAAETDPKMQEIFRRDAEEKAAQAAVTKANADLAVAQARQAARQRAVVDRPLRLAQAAPPDSHASASSSQESESSIDGVATVRRSHQGDGGNDNEAADARRAVMLRAKDAQRQAMQAMADAHIDQQVARAMADAHLSETIARALADAHLDEATRKAIADAHIEQRIAEAMARVQPQIEAAARRLPAPPAIAPVPPLPAPPAALVIPAPPAPPPPLN